MKVYVEKKPITVTARTKDELMSKIRNSSEAVGHSMSTYGHGLKGILTDTFIMYNAQKFRRKRGVRKGYWVAYIYKFDTNFLRYSNLYVEQGNRTFTIKEKK